MKSKIPNTPANPINLNFYIFEATVKGSNIAATMRTIKI